MAVTITAIYSDSRNRQNGGRPPSWICCVRVWTTHIEHLVVFISVQNLVGIDAVVLTNEDFNICHVWLKNAYSGP